MLVFCSDPSRDDLVVLGSSDVIVARVPAVIWVPVVTRWVNEVLDLFPDEPVWLGEPANASPSGSFLSFTVMLALRQRQMIHLWLVDTHPLAAAQV